METIECPKIIKVLGPNHYTIRGTDGFYLQSYDVIVAFTPYAKMGNFDYLQVVLDYQYWQYSKTTSKYRNLFLSETSKETEAHVASGKYILADLN